jgi:hypothetical protein
LHELGHAFYLDQITDYDGMAAVDVAWMPP